MRVVSGPAHPRQRDHGREQHHAIEPAMPGMGRAQENRRAHGMRQRKDRRRTVRQHDLVDEGFEVDLVLREIAHVAFAPIAQRAFRHPLPAPVERGDREAARAQVAHGLEIFLDELGAALEQADRALAPRRRRPAREAQFDAVAGLEGSRDGAVGHRIGGDGDEGHDLREPERDGDAL